MRVQWLQAERGKRPRRLPWALALAFSLAGLAQPAAAAGRTAAASCACPQASSYSGFVADAHRRYELVYPVRKAPRAEKPPARRPALRRRATSQAAPARPRQARARPAHARPKAVKRARAKPVHAKPAAPKRAAAKRVRAKPAAAMPKPARTKPAAPSAAAAKPPRTKAAPAMPAQPKSKKPERTVHPRHFRLHPKTPYVGSPEWHEEEAQAARRETQIKQKIRSICGSC